MPLAFTPSANVAQLRESATIAVSQRAKALKAEGRSIIDLGAGEPDFDTPEFIIQAAQRALDGGATRYTAVDGILPLRQAIADVANESTGGAERATPADVVVSTGSKQSLYNACTVLFGPGDEVLVPVPSWTSYFEMVGLARATAVEVPGDPAIGLKVTPELLARSATSRTRGVMLNSPSNPTGAVYDSDELRAILDLAQERGWWVISDEIYRRIAYNGVAPSALDVATARDNLIVIDGVAKAYAMTGWRIGWAIAPRAVAKAMTAFQSHTTSNATTFAQYGALAALTDPAASDSAIAGMVAQYRTRRDAALEVLASQPSLPIVRPDGAFYLFFDVSRAAPASADPGGDFCTRLLDTYGVAIVPGSAFRTPNWVRLSYAAPEGEVIAGVTRVVGLYAAMAEGGDGRSVAPVRDVLLNR